MRLLKDIWNDDFNYCYLTTRGMLDHVIFMFSIMIPYWRLNVHRGALLLVPQ